MKALTSPSPYQLQFNTVHSPILNIKSSRTFSWLLYVFQVICTGRWPSTPNSSRFIAGHPCQRLPTGLCVVGIIPYPTVRSLFPPQMLHSLLLLSMRAAANSTALLLTIRSTKAALPYFSVAPATTDAPPCPCSARPSDRLDLPNAPLVRPREASQSAGESRRVARTSRAARYSPSDRPFELSGRKSCRRSAG